MPVALQESWKLEHYLGQTSAEIVSRGIRTLESVGCSQPVCVWDMLFDDTWWKAARPMYNFEKLDWLQA